MVEAVGHADGDLDPVVERLEPRVRVPQLDRPEDIGAASSDLLGKFDDLGDARVGCPEHPVVQLAAGLFDGVFEQVAQELLDVFCQTGVGRFGVFFGPFERLFLGRLSVG